MPLLLRNSIAADAAVLADIYLSAFSIDAISLRVFPRSSTGTRDFLAWTWCYNSIVEQLESPNAHFICIYEPDSLDQKIVSYAKWHGPDELFGTGMPVWPEEADIALANHFFSTLVNRHAGKGAAGKLLRWGIQKSDEEGIETYLEASPDGKQIYEHLGFQEVERLVVELEGNGEGVLAEKEFTEVLMIRPVQKKD